MSLTAPENSAIPDNAATHHKLDDAVELLKTSGYTEIAGRLEADLPDEQGSAQ